MIRRYCKRAGIPSFGLQDMKAKGATDMSLAQVPLEVIQALCGHESKTTTEIYIKRHMTTIAAPNQLALGGK
jgi:integrase